MEENNTPATNERFICVATEGGIIQKVSEHHDLDAAKSWIKDHIRDVGFDPECDDVRIFCLHDGQTNADLGQEIEMGDEVEAWTDEADAA